MSGGTNDEEQLKSINSSALESRSQEHIAVQNQMTTFKVETLPMST
jgi:hypothetical protein